MSRFIKSILSIVITVILCLSSLACVSAEPSSKGQNLLPQGSFDNEWDVTRFYPAGVTPKWDAEGAEGTTGSMMGEKYGGSSCVKWETQVLPGETYDISFYAKCTGIATTIWMPASFRGTSGQFEKIMEETPIGTSWKKYELTWTVPTKAKNGENIPGQVEISVRTDNDSKANETLWIDEIKVISHGNIPADYHDVTGERGEWEDELPAKKTVSNISFSDTKNHWAEGILKALASNGYVNGYEDGTFRPQNNVTRAEFITLVMNSFKISNISYNGAYSDVKESDYYAVSVQTARQLNIINPAMTITNKFLPNQPITRQEAASILNGAVKAKGSNAAENCPISFSDQNDIAKWAMSDVLSVASKGLITGYETGKFIPKGNLTRAEAATMLMRMLELDTRVAVFVDGVDGDDTNDGTSSHPVETIDKARQIVRNEKKNMKHNIFVLIKEGEYYLDNSLEFSQEDSGENGYNVVYTSYGTEKPVIMMGEHFSGFRKYDSSKNIYRVDIGGLDARQVYINGVRGIRARSEGYHGLTNVTNEIAYGHTTTDTFLADYKYPQELEMVYMVEWAQQYGKVDKIEVEGNIAKISIQPDWWTYATNDGDTSVGVTKVGVPLWYENAYELLDNPGEFYINTHDGYLYYIPRPYENPETMVATVPVGERLLTLNGTVDEKIHNLVFDNLQFSYTTWMKPTEKGHIEKQNVERTIDGDLIMIPGAVLTLNARYVDFLNCEFSKLGASALAMYGATQDCNVIGNEIYDVAAVGFALGSVTHTEEYKENYYMTNTNPVQYKYFTVNNNISNNYIHEVALDYGSSAGISAAYPKRTVFAHNEIGNMVYSGFHMGWNWSGNLYTGTGIYDMDIKDNYVYDTMNDKLQDGAAIYMLGTTGGTMEKPNEVSGNYVQRVRGYGAYIYTDDAASFYRFTGNVLEHDHIDERYTQDGTLGRLEGFKFYRWNHKGLVATDNYLNGQVERIYVPYDIHNTSTYAGEILTLQNADINQAETGKYFGVNSIYDNHNLEPGTPWPDDAKSIIDNSGLEEEYHHLFSGDTIRTIRGEKLIELGVGEKTKVDITLYGRKVTLDSSYLPENTYYVSSRPDIVEVDADGNIKGISSGRAEIWTYVPVGDRVLRGRTEVLCGKDIKTVDLGLENFNFVKGYTTKLEPKVITVADKVEDIVATYTVDDESVIKVNGETNEITAVGAGNTTLHVTVTYAGSTKTVDFPVNVISFENPEAVNLDYQKADSSFFNAKSWTMAETIDGGVSVSTPGGQSVNIQKKYKGLINFDMILTEETLTSWPSFALSMDGKGYSSGDMYFISFYEGKLELHRFNNGKRTLISGEVAGFEPLAGKGIPNNGVLEFGKKHNVTIGTIVEKDVTYVVLNIDGKSVIYYPDTDEGRLTDNYYPMIYARKGAFNMFPATENK